MAVIRTELSVNAYIFPLVIRIHVDQALRYHNRDDIIGFAQPRDFHIHHVKAFTENLMAKRKSADNFAHYCCLVVFNYLICHFKVLPSCYKNFFLSCNSILWGFFLIYEYTEAHNSPFPDICTRFRQFFPYFCVEKQLFGRFNGCIRKKAVIYLYRLNPEMMKYAAGMPQYKPLWRRNVRKK